MTIKPSLLTAVTAGSLWATAIFSLPSNAQSIRFLCTVDTNNIPTTYAQTPDGSVPVFKWTSNYFRPPYTPMQRCQEVTERMNTFAAQGNLDYLTSGKVNRLPVVCAGTSCNPNGSNVLLTLKPNQSPNQVLQEIEANRQGAGGPSYQLTGESSSHNRPGVLSQNTDGTVTLDMNKYLSLSSKQPEVSQPSQPSAPGIIPSTPSGSQNSPSQVW